MQNWAHLAMWVQEGTNYGAAAEALKFYQWSNGKYLPGDGDEDIKKREKILSKLEQDNGWDELTSVSLEFSNPTHTQLSKDKEHHPLHSLAK